MTSHIIARYLALLGLLVLLAPSARGAFHLPMVRINPAVSSVDGSGGLGDNVIQAISGDRRRSIEGESIEPRYFPNDGSGEDQHDAQERVIELEMTPHTQSFGSKRRGIKKRQDQTATSTTSSVASGSHASSTAQSGSTDDQYQSSDSSNSTGSNAGTGSASSTATKVWGVDPKSTLGASSTLNAADYPAETMAVDGTTGAGIIYTMNITVDGATLPVHIDTGSSQLWVPHASCGDCVNSGMKYINTALPEECAGSASHTIQYAKGKVTGCLVNTSVTLGDDTLAQYSVLAVTQVSADITANAEYYSGRIGLAGSNLTIDKGPTVISALYQQGTIQTPVVGFYLPHRDEAWDSEISFGDPETSEHADAQKQVTLPSVGDPNEHYVIRFDEFRINGQPVSGSNTAYIDTGFSGLGVAQSLHEYVLKQIYVNYTKEESGISVPCYPAYEWPTLTFQFSGQGFDIDYRDMNTHPDDDPDGKCWSMISGMPENYKGLETPWVLGDTFLHNVYHSVNVETGEVKIFGLREGTS
ncbi:hypothetical protein IAU59_007233 [Kwoniella sp. CBS 9459]